MSGRTCAVKLELTVAEDADDIAVADFFFELLVNSPEVDAEDSIWSVDGVDPVRR